MCENMMSPCKDCTERKIGCHSKCELYKQFREEVECYNNLRRKEVINTHDSKKER